MKSAKIISIIILILVQFGISVQPLDAQRVRKVGTSAAAFLRIFVGSRGSAMGGAFVSVANDPSAMYWNPGGLAQLKQSSVYVDHSPYLPGLDFNFLGLVLASRNLGTVGVSVTALTTERMLVTTPDHPMGTGETFTAASIAVGITYSRFLTDRFSIGGTFKYVNERIYNSSAAGIAFDIGTIFVTPFYGIRLGVSISNFGNKMQMLGEDLNVRVDIAPDIQGNNQSVVGQLKTDRFEMPLIMRVGLSWDVIQTGSSRFTVAVDGVNPNDNAQSINLGAEYALFNETLQLRAGYNDMFLPDREKGLTLGVGLNIQQIQRLNIQVGYAYQEFRYLGGVNRFSFAISF
ncbi:MAG: PorV/PorQ family protein [Calditrichaeota bacterium]|nr:PorV/PorQ family protein [Calditrichota bacterium]